MEQKTFQLSNTRTFRRGVRIFVKDAAGKVSDMLCMFTTEKIVSERERYTNARTKAAEYKTTNEMVVNALFSDAAYGKDFYLKGDEEGKLKRSSFVVSQEDIERASLESLFNSAGLIFDRSKSIPILKKEYSLHLEALGGRKIKESGPLEIPHIPVDVPKDIINAKVEARNKYEELYGEPVPEIVFDDIAFLDGMSNPDFKAQAYIKTKTEEAEAAQKSGSDAGDSKEDLYKVYFEKFKKNVPNAKKNDIAWIKGQLSE